MNRRELETIRKNNYSKLDRSYRNCLNHFEYDSGNSIEHEMAKFICFVLLRNGISPILLENFFSNDVASGKKVKGEGVLITYRYYKKKT